MQPYEQKSGYCQPVETKWTCTLSYLIIKRGWLHYFTISPMRSKTILLYPVWQAKRLGTATQQDSTNWTALFPVPKHSHTASPDSFACPYLICPSRPNPLYEAERGHWLSHISFLQVHHFSLAWLCDSLLKRFYGDVKGEGDVNDLKKKKKKGSAAIKKKKKQLGKWE